MTIAAWVMGLVVLAVAIGLLTAWQLNVDNERRRPMREPRSVTADQLARLLPAAPADAPWTPPPGHAPVVLDLDAYNPATGHRRGRQCWQTNRCNCAAELHAALTEYGRLSVPPKVLDVWGPLIDQQVDAARAALARAQVDPVMAWEAGAR